MNNNLPLITNNSPHNTEKFLAMGDTYEKFQYNLKHMPSNWRYRTQDISYHLNSESCRAPEFDQIDWKNSVAVLGCSYVFGEGVPDHFTIPAAVSRLTGLNAINLGVPGAGNDSIFFNALNIQKYRPRLTVVFWTHIARTVVWNEYGNPHLITSGNVDRDDIPYGLDFTEYFYSGMDLRYRHQMFKTLLQTVLGNQVLQSDQLVEHAFGKLWESYFKETDQAHLLPNNTRWPTTKRLTELSDRFLNDCFARDISWRPDGSFVSHYGPWVNEHLAKNVLSDYKP